MIAAVSVFASCDVQSGITKKSVEKYAPTPTPSPSPTPEPIDPADIVRVDTKAQGGMVPVNESDEKKDVECSKYEQVMVNGDGAAITIKGACRQILVNGDRNEITAEAASEIVFNGNENSVKYYRYVNGERPFVTDNSKTNNAEKIDAPAEKK